MERLPSLFMSEEEEPMTGARAKRRTNRKGLRKMIAQVKKIAYVEVRKILY